VHIAWHPDLTGGQSLLRKASILTPEGSRGLAASGLGGWYGMCGRPGRRSFPCFDMLFRARFLQPSSSRSSLFFLSPPSHSKILPPRHGRAFPAPSL